MTTQAATSLFTFDNTYARDLEGFYVDWQAEEAKAPRVLALNYELAEELGIPKDALESDNALSVFAGNTPAVGAVNIAQAYAGHQFGGFSPSLGDGRALLLGEAIDTRGERRDIQLKGSGRTPFSRGGDGKAAVGPVLREYLLSEAMHALSIPTTRALAAVATGELVFRETALPGAILTRVAASHIRVGTFQYFAVRKEWPKIRQLADYVIKRHYPAAAGADNPTLALFKAVLNAQARLVAQWMTVGFIHGVMNTDNMTISGETIDYGPCAFMDRYDPATVFSSIDTQGRYAYGNQPAIAQWNLARFAETLITAVDEDQDRAIEQLTGILNGFPKVYVGHWLDLMRAKIGIVDQHDADLDLINDLFGALEGQNVDYTLFFRHLSSASAPDQVDGTESLKSLFDDPSAIETWLPRWRERLAGSEDRSASDIENRMNAVNPIYIPRNHKVEEALAAAVQYDDLGPFRKLLAVLKSPFTEQDGCESFAKPAPLDAAPYQTFCGT